MPAASINRYSSYKPSYGYSYGSSTNRTTSLDRNAYVPKSSKHEASSNSFVNGNYTSRYSSGLPPRPYTETYRSTRNIRSSPPRFTRFSDSGGLSDITRQSRYTVGKYRESSTSRDSGNTSRFSSNDYSDSDYLRRHSVGRRRDSLNDKSSTLDKIRAYEYSRTDPVEERLANSRRRLGLSPVKDILSNKNRFSTAEQNGNLDSYKFSNGRSINNNITNRYDDGLHKSTKDSLHTSNFIKKRINSSTDDIYPSYSALKPSTESILASIRNSTTSVKPPSPPPQPPVKETISNYMKQKNEEREKKTAAMKERIAARLNQDCDDAPHRKRNPTTGSTESFNESNGLVGLANLGNTCFMNSIIQCLSNTPCLMEYLVRESYSFDINTTLSTMKGELVKAFASLLTKMWKENGAPVSARDFKYQLETFAPTFVGYGQHDAQEFLRKMLEGLHEDVNRVKVRPLAITQDISDTLSGDDIAIESWKRYIRYDDSKIVDMFVGQLKSSLQCSHCHHLSVTFDPFWDLSLPIPDKTGSVELSQCLDLFTKEEVLDNDERPKCSKCQERQRMTKTFSVHKFPKVLVIHLKRFSPLERWRAKLNSNVKFPLQDLDLTPYASNKNTSCRYNLIGVANHSGSLHSGHYTAYCRHPYLGTWHSYNDTSVGSLSENKVCTSGAYVLFYELSN